MREKGHQDGLKGVWELADITAVAPAVVCQVCIMKECRGMGVELGWTQFATPHLNPPPLDPSSQNFNPLYQSPLTSSWPRPHWDVKHHRSRDSGHLCERANLMLIRRKIVARPKIGGRNSHAVGVWPFLGSFHGAVIMSGITQACGL